MSEIQHEHNWQPWDSSKGILYCRDCNSRISRADLSDRESQKRASVRSLRIARWSLIVAIISMVVSIVIAIAGSAISWIIAQNSMKISKKSLDPKIAIEAVKFEDSGSFIWGERINGGIQLRFRFRIQNMGGSYARNINISNIYSTGQEVIHDPVVELVLVSQNKAKTSPSGSFVLAPQEIKILEVSATHSIIDPRAVTEALDKISKMNSEFQVPFNMEISYEGERTVDEDNQHKIGLKITLSPNGTDWETSFIW